jgi:tryptophan-rich sensory protein
MMQRSIVKPILVAALAATLVAGLGTTMTDLGPWYQGLRKPSWQPPDWLFGPAWTIIFACAAWAAATAWRDARSRSDRDLLIILFCINGLLNVGWSLLFFRLQRLDLALIEVGGLWLSIVALMVTTMRYSRSAALLLLPYLIWVSFAAVLNWAVWTLN